MLIVFFLLMYINHYKNYYVIGKLKIVQKSKINESLLARARAQINNTLKSNYNNKCLWNCVKIITTKCI